VSLNYRSQKKSDLVMMKVAKLRDLPTLSVVVGSVLDRLRDGGSGRQEIAQLLKKDQVLTSRILRMVNSGFFARPQEITNVEKALHFLGDHTVMALVMGTRVFSEDDVGANDWFNVHDFWLHCLAAAIASEYLAIHCGKVDPEDAFTCGLLHDLGKMALFRADRESAKEVVEKAYKEGISFLEAEQEVGLPGHHLVGERMAAQWSLPLVVRKTQRYHHRNVIPFESIDELHRKTIMVATLGDIMAKRCGLGFSGDQIIPDYNDEYLEHLGLSRAYLEVLEYQLPIETMQARELLIKRDWVRRAA